MLVNKWNFITREYEKVKIPDDRKVELYSDDMNKIIQCINCGKELRFGDSYTSRRYHTKMGFGYCVCPTCYEEEWKLEYKTNEDWKEDQK